MLAIFNPTVASAPEEISIPDEASGQTDSAGILNSYKNAHESAITVDFGKTCVMAYCHDKQELLRPRYFAVVDEMYCMFVGTLENISQLRHQYGISNSVSEVTLVIEIYRALRDRSPYPTDHVMRGLSGAFSFVLFDNSTRSIFVAVDSQGKVPFYWASATDGCLAFSDEASLLKEKCSKTFSTFPAGCFFSSAGGLESYEHPLTPVTGIARVDSRGQVCGATFNVDPTDPKKKEASRSTSFPRVGSESWGSESWGK